MGSGAEPERQILTLERSNSRTLGWWLMAV
jgi:hypothetical protein